MIYHDRDTPQKAADRESYYWYKEHGICWYCKQNKVYLPRSKTMCLQCLEDRKEYIREYRKKSTEQQYRETMHAKRYQELLTAFEVCQSCHKRDAAKGHVFCNICLAKKRNKNEKKRRERGVLPRGFYTPTICENCHKEKPDNGRKLCDKCYDSSIRALEIGRQNQDNKKHYWRLDNSIVFHGRDNA